MSAVKDVCSVVSSLVPMYSAGNQIEERGALNEKQMCAVAILIAETVLGAIQAIVKNNPKAFDANSGDGACQNQAIELRRILALDLSEECRELEATACVLKELVQMRKSNPKERNKMTPVAFFRENVEPIVISKEMEYLLHCFLLKVTRLPYRTLENGVVLTRTDPSRLIMLSKRISNVSPIVNAAQVNLSMLNMETIRVHAETLSTVENKDVVMTMLSVEQTHLYTPSSRYAPKAIGSLFYCIKTVMYHLREEGALIALKSIVAEGKPFYLLMQPKTKGGPFKIVPDEAYKEFSLDTQIVVFEAVVIGDRSEVAEAVRSRGFTDLALTCTAKEAPYERDSDLTSVQVPEALFEIEGYQMQSGCIALDHVYLTTLKAEGVINDETT